MRALTSSLAMVCLALAPAPERVAQPAPERADRALVIRNVTVFTAATSPPIERATVVVQGDRIAAISTVVGSVPAGAHVVDGSGKFLVPGFIDLHAHLSKTRSSSLGLFVANGVTTLRDMGGDHEELLGWRRDVQSGKRLGPRILIAGPYLEAARNVERMRKDPPSERIEPFERTRVAVATPDDARRIVASLAERKSVDFLKIRTVQDRATYLALNAAADAHGLRLVGHVAGIPPEVVLDAGQDGIDHTFYPSLEEPSKETRLALWRRFAERRVPVVPTLVTFTQASLPSIDQLRAVAADDDGRVDRRRRYLARYLVLDWREQLLETTAERQALLAKIWPGIKRDLREMHEAGMDLLVGTDAAVLNIFPGFSIHDEMAAFVTELGLEPGEVLERATSRAARFLGIGDEVGTIETGKIADLVLLDADPGTDIRHTRRISAVVLRGQLYDRRALDRLMDDVEAAPDRQRDDWGRTTGHGKI